MQKVKSETEMYWINESEVQALNLRGKHVRTSAFWAELNDNEIVIKFAVCGHGDARLAVVNTGWLCFEEDSEARLMRWMLRVARWVRDTLEVSSSITFLIKPEADESGYREDVEELLELSEGECGGTNVSHVSYGRLHSPFILDC